MTEKVEKAEKVHSIEVSKLINAPMEVPIGDKTLKMRQLKLKELFAFFEQKIKSEKLIEAQQMANLMEGEEKTKFLVSAWKNLPCGEELSDKIVSNMGTISGIADLIFMAARDFQEGLTEEDVMNLIDIGNLDVLSPIINWITGIDDQEGDKKKQGKKK